MTFDYIFRNNLHAIQEATGMLHLLSKEHLGYKVNKGKSIIEEDVIYVGPFINVWGHCITDNLKKLWFLFTDEAKDLQKHGVKIAVSTIDNVPLKPYMFSLLQILDLNPDTWLFTTDVSDYRTIYEPEDALIWEGKKYESHLFYTREFAEVVNRIQLGFPSIPQENCLEKVYFSRSRFSKSRREMGEKSIERAFKNEGYSIVYPENLSLSEQFNILQNCSIFAATEGSISHSAIFCKPGTKVILLRKANYVNEYQVVLNEITNLDVTYVDAHFTPDDTEWGSLMYGPFFLGITSELERFWGHRIPHLPLWANPQWWWFKNRNRKCLKWLKKIVEK